MSKLVDGHISIFLLILIRLVIMNVSLLNSFSTSVRRFLAGSLAGITSQSFTYPLDLARARMAVSDKYTGYRYMKQQYLIKICSLLC